MNKSMLKRGIVAVIAALGLTVPSVFAITYTWDGGGVTDNWNNADNWDANGIPGNAVDDITYINNGGTAVIAADAVSYNLTLAFAAANTGFIEQTGGTLDVTNLLQLRQGTSAYTLKGGTLNTGGIEMGRFTTDPSQSYTFTQTGGTLLNRGGWRIDNGDYTISGGSFQQNGRFTIYSGGSFRIIGSGSSITVGDGGTTTSYGFEGTEGTVEFVLDNSAAHISTIEMDATQNRRSGILKVSLNGGVLLTGQDTFKLTHTTGNYNTINLGWGDAGPLWTVALNQGGAGDRYDAVTLNAANSKGNLDAAIDKNRLELGGSTYGYVTLSNVVGSTLEIGLDFGDGYNVQDLDLFKAGLTDAGIDWTTGYGVYEVGLFLDPSVSGDEYFAWDLGGIGDGTLQLQGIANVIPEPSSIVLLALAGLALLRRRRR